jgi:hypothetical protein
MERIFVSSLARGEMGAIRQGARHGVESLGMFPVMYETQPASDQNSRRALLDQIPNCDAYLLLLGAEYGEPMESGLSPTEEEFEEALRSGRPILALVQDGVDREERQLQFVARVRGSWEGGHFAPAFAGSGDIVAAVVRTLNGWRSSGPDAERREAADARVLELVRGADRPGMMPGGPKLRMVAVPLLSRPLLDAVRLTDGRTVDGLIAAARTSGQIPQAQGVEPHVAPDDSIHLRYAPASGFDQLELIIGADGAVVTEAGVGGSSRMIGSMVLMHDRIPDAVLAGLRFAEEAWRLLDTRGEIKQVLLAAAVPGANSKAYSFQEPGNSVSQGGLHGLPELLVVPAQPLLVRRQDLMLDDNAARLQAEIRHRYESAGAVNRP